MPQPRFAPPNYRLENETRERLLRHVVPAGVGSSIRWIERRSVARPPTETDQAEDENSQDWKAGKEE